MTLLCSPRMLSLGLLAALGLLIVSGCETPSPTTPFEQARDAFAAGQWAESIMFSTEAISQHPDDLRAYVLRGRAFRRLGQLEPAITDYTIAIHLKPENPEFYYLRADAYKERYDKYEDRGDIDLSDADNKTGQKLDPTYQRAYLFAPPDGSIDLSAVAGELSRTLRDNGKESADEPGEVAKRKGKRPRAQSETDSDVAIDLSPDELFESDDAPAESALNEREIKDAYGIPIDTDLNRSSAGLFAPGAAGAPPTATQSRNSGEGLAGRQLPRRKPSGPQQDRLAQGDAEQGPRTAEQGPVQRGRSRSDSDFYPPQRSLHPFGAAAMRPTGASSYEFGEEGASEFESGDGIRGGGGQRAGGGPHRGDDFGSANPNGAGGRGYGAPLDPYGGYTRSARPTGPLAGNPYGGSIAPYGCANSPGGSGRHGGSAPRDPDVGGNAVNPFGPLPVAPVPFINPPGFRYD